MHYARSSQLELSISDDRKLILEKLSRYMDNVNLEKISRISSYELLKWILEVVELVRPRKVFVVTDKPEDLEYIRKVAVERGEEYSSRYNPRHTVHIDGPRDLARDRENTRILTLGDVKIPMVNTMEKTKGLAEIRGMLNGIMENKEMFIGLYCFGPKNSPFSLYGVQATDSAYVIHSSNILYRICYDVFTERDDIQFMRFLHSAGERDENGWSRNIHMRRIFIDPDENTVYSVNTQYAGNTVGLKKLSLRLCMYRGFRESWLCEHMFIIGVKGPGGRVSYFTGAFPAGCGKTSTALIADTLVGDDLAIIRNVEGEARAINPEIGMFGIIDGINPRDDPEIYEVLTSRETEVIFANVLLTDDGDIWWNGKPYPPRSGVNYAGKWTPGMRDEYGVEIPPSHPNGRFTTSIFYLKRVDPRIEDPLGVPVKGMVFGGRDPDTWVPVEESFDWDHGIVTKGASLESEITAAVLGQVGRLEFNPFAILDFLSVSPGAFVELHFRFGRSLREKPRIFGVNYFLRDESGKYLSEKADKLAWLKWMELRVNNDVEAVEAPTGLIPLYNDLSQLFNKYLNKEFSEELYSKLFTVRIIKHLEKIERVWRIYEAIGDAPRKLFDILMWQKKRLEDSRARYGDVIDPFSLDRK